MPCHTQTSWSKGHESKEEKEAIRHERNLTKGQVRQKKNDEEKAVHEGREDSQTELIRQKKGKKAVTSSPAQKIRMPNTSPFSLEIVSMPVNRVKLPGYVRYDGSTDPTEHLNAYQGLCLLELTMMLPGVRILP